MRYMDAQIAAHNRLAQGIYALTLECDAATGAKPGQFVNVYLGDGSRILPRPISICEAFEGRMRLVYRVSGAGTEEISTYEPGGIIRITAPIGRGYPIDEIEKYDKVVLMGGGIGIPPMVFLCRLLDGRCTVVLGYRDSETFLLNDFREYGAEVIIASDDGSVGVCGTVMDAMREAGVKPDVICGCGPKPMLRAIKQYASDSDIPAYISLEERMACGIGACLGCVTPTTETDAHSHVRNARVCVDGPVFMASQVEL